MCTIFIILKNVTHRQTNINGFHKGAESKAEILKFSHFQRGKKQKPFFFPGFG